MAGVTTTAVPAPPRAEPAVARAALRNGVERLAVPMPTDRLTSWAAALAVTAIAGFLRFWRLGDPHAFVFDETYYAKDGWTLLHVGAEQQWPDKPDAGILANGGTTKWLDSASYVVHPPIGKWVIGLGEAIFGFTPYGWRFMVAVLGTLSVLVMCRAARRLFRSTLLGCTAGLLMTVDGLHFVHSRTALLDLTLMFWAFVGFACLLIDRDQTRARLADRVAQHGPIAGFGGRLGWRPWRLAAAVSLGLACGTKWSGIYFVAAFGLMVYAWDYGARRVAGVRIGPPLASTLVPAAALVLVLLLRKHLALALTLDAVLVFGTLVLAAALRYRLDWRAVAGAWAHALTSAVVVVVVPLLAYVASWTGWFLADKDLAYKANGTVAQAHSHGVLGEFGGKLWGLWDYHKEAWAFHNGLESFHPYASNPWSWSIVGRPVSFFYEGPKKGEHGCTVANCSKAITALGTPLLWWSACLGFLVVLCVWIGRRDWRAGAIITGLAAGYFPWFIYQRRTIYSFYAIAFEPWVILTVTMCLGLLLGGRWASDRRRMWGAVAVGTYVCVVIADFALLYPVLSAQVIPYHDWQIRMWLDSWV